MSIRTFFHDLAVRFVVLGWIFARKPLKWAPKGHNFQPKPPVQVGALAAGSLLALSLALGGLWFRFTFPDKSQVVSRRPQAMS
ncbi:hypothetical protein CcrKarma_gp335 [Caulobacter virus Karma]|uniref:hypothetical protein n=1 Tax=Caulobacter virus Magneto TaxID=1211642 RepID=UPI00028A7B89|nr:hypothetical protein CcrMagneto_gp002 [Caulobacter virus Magneto]YP_006989012.1 hypothetical protein CcrMagneto_gp330 [Caulobacter virus Magneto]YP_006989382.1 hypothetical protein CcrKarma_gp002 [Caulobacter virus Karma]YP_006989715.1 hypothetical protein CcrKarma_gp335 [Caulobacter virus Karma]AFU87172.1 hypothetical protein CcrMagneto_gp002 [Caulobacter virus Magneto]AFU87500.1 hypothetical protein CcrMagneto_gp330 [Caulobacter virus Magneto]AFU87519.1 hypothetical protein CcrKarma_gp00